MRSSHALLRAFWRRPASLNKVEACIHRKFSPALVPAASSASLLRRKMVLHDLRFRFFGSVTHSEDGDAGPVPVDYRSLLDEKEFHKLSDELLYYLQEKIDEFGEELDIDGFDVDHAEGVLTIKLGSRGTYVINKQTPNRQIWLSSPVSGPARFDWDSEEQRWIYRRNKTEILQLLETELTDLLGSPITLSR